MNPPPPSRHSGQSSQFSTFGGPTWYENTTFEFHGFQPIRSVSKLDPFRAPDYQRVSGRVVKIGKKMSHRNIRFSGQAKGGGEEYVWSSTKAIKQYSFTKDKTFQVIPFTLEIPALAWFRAEENKIRDYSDFIELFRKRFSSSDSRAKLWEEIRGRT